MDQLLPAGFSLFRVVSFLSSTTDIVCKPVQNVIGDLIMNQLWSTLSIWFTLACLIRLCHDIFKWFGDDLSGKVDQVQSNRPTGSAPAFVFTTLVVIWCNFAYGRGCEFLFWWDESFRQFFSIAPRAWNLLKNHLLETFMRVHAQPRKATTTDCVTIGLSGLVLLMCASTILSCVSPAKGKTKSKKKYA